MNKLTFITLLVAVSGAAYAESPTIDDTPFVSTKSRAEVAAELAAFKRGPNPFSISYNQFANAPAVKSRAEVQAEMLAARRSGALDAMTGEDSGSSYLAQQQSLPTTVYAAK